MTEPAVLIEVSAPRYSLATSEIRVRRIYPFWLGKVQCIRDDLWNCIACPLVNAAAY